MEEIKIKGIVIKSIDYKDSDKIVTIFSAELGLINARVRGVKKNKAKLSFAVQPFAFIEFLLIKSGNFYNCINATSIDQFFDITLDFDNYIFMLACLEVCAKTVKENDAEPELFILLLNSLNMVCYNGLNSMYVFIKFILETMKILGFEMTVSNCSLCNEKVQNNKFLAFSYEYNGVICEKCAKNEDCLELSKGEYAILKFINESSLENLSKLKFLSRNDLISVINLLIKDFRFLTEQSIETIKKFL
ncbi:MAG: DNA repair protein RecO [Clostridia bacterium]|nr:DNA repair protein RecO [Clostridia bacterium]